MLSLESPVWQRLTHAYGKASDVPGLLARLSANTAPANSYKDEPWLSLWSSLCHQGDVYTASYAALPHIVQIGTNALGPVDAGFFSLPACIEVARNKRRGPEIPPELAAAYFDGLRGLHKCAFHHASDDWNEGMAQVVAAALAASKGQFKLAEALMDLDDDIIEKVIAQEL